MGGGGVDDDDAVLRDAVVLGVFRGVVADDGVIRQDDAFLDDAAAQAARPKSMLMLYRKLLALRQRHDTLHAGAIADVVAEGEVLRYRRVGLEDGESTDFQVVLNLGVEVATVPCGKGTVVLTTLLDGEGSAVEGEVTVEGGEGLLIALA